MAAGKWNMQKASGGVASITVADGTTNTDLVLPESGNVATTTDVSSAVASGVAPKANTADLKEIGVGQTQQNVTFANTPATTTYTNVTSKPVFISVQASGSSSTSILTLTVNGVQVGEASFGQGSSAAVLYGIVKAGNTAVIVTSGANFSVGRYSILA